MFRMFLAAVAALLLALPAAAQNAAQNAPAAGENLMKACGDRWRAVRAEESANGVTWPQYLSRCRAESAKTDSAKTDSAKTAAAPATQAAAPAAARAPAPAESKATSPGRAGAAPVFPQEVASKHAGERPALARQRTCADQFKANKASGANGGLRWIEQGGGYWSQCNAHLKQARA